MKSLEDLGRGTTGLFEYAGGLTRLTVEASTVIGRLRVRLRETLAQMYFLGVQSLAIVLLTSLATGMVIALESASQAVTYGVGNLVGGAVTLTTSRELGPMLTAVVVAGRAGAAIAAELGSMVVTEQIEAIEALGLSPVQMLVVPRLVAMLVMLPLLTIFADIIAIAGGAFLAKAAAGIGYDEFVESTRQLGHFNDFLLGMIKALVFAVIVVTVSCYQGLNTRGGAAGVGRATTGSVVVSIILIFFANFLLSFIMFRSIS